MILRNGLPVDLRQCLKTPAVWHFFLFSTEILRKKKHKQTSYEALDAQINELTIHRISFLDQL